MFSAVIPTKDNSSSLSRALLSTKNKNIVERIVVTDSYLSITPNPLADKWLSNYKQLGPGIARNKGILEAKGDFLLFLDSDDEFYLTGIEKVADYINCFNGKPPDIVVFDCDFVSHNGAFLEDRDDLHFFEQSRNDLLRDYLELRVRHECMFFAFRRDFLLENNIKFRPGFHEDVDFVFEALLRAEKVELIREKVYKKYISKGQITSSFEEEHLHGL